MGAADNDDLLAQDKYEGMFSGQRIGGLGTVKLNIIGEELDFLEKGSRPIPAARAAVGPRVKHPRERGASEAKERRQNMRNTMKSIQGWAHSTTSTQSPTWVEEKRASGRPAWVDSTRRPSSVSQGGRPSSSVGSERAGKAESTTGFVGRMRNTCSQEAAHQRSGLDPDATRDRLFGVSHGPGRSHDARFATTYGAQFKHFPGADEMSLFATRKKQAAAMRSASACEMSSETTGPQFGLKHVDTKVVEDLKRRQEKFRNKRTNTFAKCPQWETTQSGNFQSWSDQLNQGNFRRVKAPIQMLSPLLAWDG